MSDISSLQAELETLESKAHGVLGNRKLTTREKREGIAALMNSYATVRHALLALLQRYREETEGKGIRRNEAGKIVCELLKKEFQFLTAFVFALQLFAVSNRNPKYPMIEVPGYPNLMPAEDAPTDEDENKTGGSTPPAGPGMR